MNEIDWLNLHPLTREYLRDIALIVLWMRRDPEQDAYMMQKWIWASYGEPEC